VLKTEAAERIRALAPERRVLFLSFVLAAPYLLSDFFKLFTVVRYRGYELHKWGEKQLSQRYYQPKVASDLEIESWISGGSNIQSMPSRGGSSAFSAVLLAARYHPAEIRLIGVDLNSGRSTALQKIAGPAAFGGNWARDRLQNLERLVKQCGIHIENDSWILAPKE